MRERERVCASSGAGGLGTQHSTVAGGNARACACHPRPEALRGYASRPLIPLLATPRRHWFFKADLFIDGEQMPENLMDIVKDTLRANKGNSGARGLMLGRATAPHRVHQLGGHPSCRGAPPPTPPHLHTPPVIGFKDNSSAIRGGPVTPVLPSTAGKPSPLAPQPRDWDLLLTAETHNFPCAVAPYPGAETGAGGRIRDTHATGIGSIMGAATAGYCVGNLRMDGCALRWVCLLLRACRLVSALVPASHKRATRLHPLAAGTPSPARTRGWSTRPAWRRPSRSSLTPPTAPLTMATSLASP